MIVMWAAAAGAAVLDVGVGHAYATVADAIAVAANRDDIVIFDALVTEEVTIEALRNLTIRAAPGVTVTWQPAAGGVGVSVGLDAEVRFERIQFLGPSVCAILVDHGDVTVVRSTFTGLDCGIYSEPDGVASVTVIRSDFVGNSGFGVQLNGAGSTAAIIGSQFIGNSASHLVETTSAGTAISIVSSVFRNNSASGLGVVYCRDACTITDSVFIDNDASSIVSVTSDLGEAVLQRNRFCGNESFFDMISLWGTAPATLQNNAFIENLGGVVQSASLALTLEHNTSLDNETNWYVGVLYATTTMVGNLVAGSISAGAAFTENPPGSTVSDYDAWWNNSGGHADFALGATDLVDIDPLLAGTGGSCSWDRIRPAVGSPLIDGDPTRLDADGTAADIGATGGPAAP